jgi:pimeloyl-ACP methyl ester carboxylesterase
MPDTPGAGHSTALPVSALAIDDLAAALAGFVDEIGLGRFALYGTHTGAAIALAFAARYPERVTALVLDGLAAWTEAERAAYRQDYAPPFLPSWDGGHLTWLWSRMEAQSLFFPWHKQSGATWRGVELSPPWHLHRNAMDMLDAGDAYRAIYQASLAFDPATFLPCAIPPRMLMPRWRRARAMLRRHGPRLACSGAAAGRVEASRWCCCTRRAPPAGFLNPCWRRLAGRFWRSTCPATASMNLNCRRMRGRSARRSIRNAGRLGWTTISLRAAGLAVSLPGQCCAPALPPRRSGRERGAMGLEPQWDGGHLLRAWRIAWRQAIFDPWYRTDAAAARNPPGDLDPDSIHAAALDLLRAGPAWVAANRIEAAGGPALPILPGQPDRWPAILQDWR